MSVGKGLGPSNLGYVSWCVSLEQLWSHNSQFAPLPECPSELRFITFLVFNKVLTGLCVPVNLLTGPKKGRCSAVLCRRLHLFFFAVSSGVRFDSQNPPEVELYKDAARIFDPCGKSQACPTLARYIAAFVYYSKSLSFLGFGDRVRDPDYGRKLYSDTNQSIQDHNESSTIRIRTFPLGRHA